MFPHSRILAALACSLLAGAGNAFAAESVASRSLAPEDGFSGSFDSIVAQAEHRGPSVGALEHETSNFKDPWEWEREHEWEYHTPASSVPEPGAALLLPLGIVAVAMAARLRSRWSRSAGSHSHVESARELQQAVTLQT